MGTVKIRFHPLRRNLAIAAPLLWLGFVLAISVEAVSKFGAPSLSYAAALDVGQYVFSALNRAEWALAGGAALGFLAPPLRRWSWILALVVGILAIQTAWLLPTLAEHAELVLAGNSPPDSHHHVFYAALEGCKILGLLGLSLIALSET